jgi:hypothetical protein
MGERNRFVLGSVGDRARFELRRQLGHVALQSASDLARQYFPERS